MKRKRLFLFAGLGVLLLLVILLSLTRSRSGNGDVEESEIRAGAVMLTNYSDYTFNLSDSSIDSVESKLFDRVKEYTDNPDKGYVGTIRKNTASTTFSKYEGSDIPIDVPTIKFVVDIPKVKQTYEVSLSGGEEYPYNILYVLCPNKSQLKYPDFGCVDENQ